MTTSVEPSSPVASRSQSRIGPSTAWAGRTGGSRAMSTPNASHASSDHARARGSSTLVDDAFEGSTASSPDACHATHEPGSVNTAAASKASGSCRATQAILGATCPGSRLQPVSSRSRGASMRAAAHSSPARRSHQISAGRSGVPSARAATSPSSWEPNDSAAISRPAVCSRSRAQRGDQRRRPLLGILLGPARVRIAELVRLVGRRHQRPVELERLGAGALRADVDADDERRLSHRDRAAGP